MLETRRPILPAHWTSASLQVSASMTLQVVSPLNCNESLHLSFGSADLDGADADENDAAGMMPFSGAEEDLMQGENASSMYVKELLGSYTCAAVDLQLVSQSTSMNPSNLDTSLLVITSILERKLAI